MRIFLLSIFSLLILTCDDKDDPYYGYLGTFNPPNIVLHPSPIIKIENELLEYDLPLIIVPIDYNRSSAEINLGITIKWKMIDSYKFYQRFKKIENAESLITDLIHANTRDVLSQYTYKYNENDSSIVSDSDIDAFEEEILITSQNIFNERNLEIEPIEVKINSIHSPKIEKEIAKHKYNDKRTLKQESQARIEAKRVIEEAIKMKKLFEEKNN